MSSTVLAGQGSPAKHGCVAAHFTIPWDLATRIYVEEARSPARRCHVHLLAQQGARVRLLGSEDFHAFFQTPLCYSHSRSATTPPVPIDPATASASDQGDDSPLAVLSGAASTTPPNEPEAQTPPMSTPEKRRWRLGSKAVPAVAKAKQGVSRVVHRVFESTALPTPHVEESWASKAMQSIIVTVVEGRALPTRLSLVAVECERSIYVAKPVAGSDPLWAVPVMDGSDNLHPNENHFVVPVVDVCNSLLHFRLHDASDMNAGAPVAFAALSVSSLLALGGGFAGEITRWLVLQSFDDTYTPVREKLGALETALKGAKPVAPKGVEAKPLGYLNVRIKLKVRCFGVVSSCLTPILSVSVLPNAYCHSVHASEPRLLG